MIFEKLVRKTVLVCWRIIDHVAWRSAKGCAATPNRGNCCPYHRQKREQAPDVGL